MNDGIETLFKPKLIFGKYSLKHLIAKGGFGEVYMGTNIFNKKNYALKIEKIENNESDLKEEAYVLILVKGPGIPSVITFGVSCKHHILVEELLGESIKMIFKKSQNKFNLKDTCMFAIQALERIEYVHSKNYLHRDIKPDNFLVGNPDKSQIYLIDFGNAKKFRSSKTGKHRRNNKKYGIYGTPTFLSLNALNGKEITRKDELESLGLVFIYLHKGFLPWSKMKVKNTREAINVIKFKREKMTLEELCSKMPREMFEYMDYINKLNFKNNPDYTFLKSLFLNVLKKIGEKNDLMFSWVDKNITPNKIRSVSKSKALQRLYNNILLSNSTKKNTPQTSNKNAIINEQILKQNQTNLKDNQINIKYNKENDELINLNKKTIESTNSINKKGNIPKPLDNNLMKIKVTKKHELKNKPFKAEEKSYLSNLNLNNNNSLINENKGRNLIKQILIKNLNNNNNKTINIKQNLKLKKFVLVSEYSKNKNEIEKNKSYMNINNINKNKLFQNNYYTYINFIKNVDTQKTNTFNRSKKSILTNLSHQNIQIKTKLNLNYKPYFYKSVLTDHSEQNSKKVKKKIRNQKEVNVKKSQLKIKTEKINKNFAHKKILKIPYNLKKQLSKNIKKEYTPLFCKGISQTYNNSPKKYY